MAPPYPKYTLHDLMMTPPMGVASVPAQKAPEKKVYYVLARPSQNRFLGTAREGRGPMVLTVREAKQFSTVGQVLEEMKRNPSASGLTQIVRITETPGAEQRVVLGETEACPAGAVVKYVVRQDAFGNPYLTGANTSWARTLDEAALFDTQAKAIHEIVSRWSGTGRVILQPTTVLRVAVQAGEPTITETVLQ